MRFLAFAATAAAVIAAPNAALALRCAPCSALFTPDGGRFPSNLELRVSVITPDVVPRVSPDTFGGFECSGIEGVDDMVVSCRPRQTPAAGRYVITNFQPQEFDELVLDVAAEADAKAPEAPRIHSAKWNDVDDDPFTRGFIELVYGTADPSPAAAEIEVRRPDGEVVVVVSRPLGRVGPTGGHRTDLMTTHSPCTCRPSFDADSLPSDAQLRVRIVDRAGNQGAWSKVATPENEPGCTCVSAPRGRSSAGIFVLMVLAAVRLRSRSAT